MSRSLIVVESPAKAKTIQKILGKGYQVLSSMGHVKDLPKSRLGVDVEKGSPPSMSSSRNGRRCSARSSRRRVPRKRSARKGCKGKKAEDAPNAEE